MDGRALSPSVGQKNTQHQLMNQTGEHDSPKHHITKNCISYFTTSELIFNIYVFLSVSCWDKQLRYFILGFSTQCVSFMLMPCFTASRVQTSHNAAVWVRRTFLRSDDEGLVDGTEQSTVSVDEVGHVLSGGEGRRADRERLRERNQTHNEPLSATEPHHDVRIQHTPAALTKHTHTVLKTHPQIHRHAHKYQKTRPQQCFPSLQLWLCCLDQMWWDKNNNKHTTRHYSLVWFPNKWLWAGSNIT